MNILEQTEHQDKKDNKAHFLHLVQVALADGVIDESELLLLHSYGKKMGFTDPEIDELIKSAPTAEYNPPYELQKRFEQVYRIAKMILADNKIDESEMALIHKIALKSGFQPQEIDFIIPFLIDGVQKRIDDEDLFEDYAKKRKRQNF